MKGTRVLCGNLRSRVHAIIDKDFYALLKYNGRQGHDVTGQDAHVFAHASARTPSLVSGLSTITSGLT